MNNSQQIGLVYSSDFLNHKSLFEHPERPERLLSIVNIFKTKEIFNKVYQIDPKESDPEQIAQVHLKSYLDQVLSILSEHKNGYLDMGDTFFSEGTKTSTLKAVGGSIELTQKIINGELSSGIALLRPPGHHAEADSPMGFCIFNNIAIAAQNLINQGIDKVAIIDFDVHHGNGTQHIFENSSQVFYASIHQSPLFPGTGDNYEVGNKDGKGYTLNIPMAPYSTGNDWLYAFKNLIIPVITDFKPNILLISAGFDAHRNDNISSQSLTDKDFFEIESMLYQLATNICNGKIAVFLEGGYDSDALANGMSNFFEVLNKNLVKTTTLQQNVSSSTIKSVQKTTKALSSHWRNL